MLPIVAFIAALTAAPPSALICPVPHLRTTSTFLSTLIADAREHSATLAGQLAKVEQSDVIAYFEAQPQMESRYRGQVHFMGASGGYRYVRIQVKTTMNRFDIVASIAHELQHVIEIAEHPEVISEDTLAALYRRIGDEHAWCMFETEEAQDAGRIVRAEILAM